MFELDLVEGILGSYLGKIPNEFVYPDRKFPNGEKLGFLDHF